MATTIKCNLGYPGGLMYALRSIAATVLMWLPAGIALGQSQELTPADEQKHAIVMTARATENGIKLRWAPTSAYAWRRCNDAGYVLVRYTIQRNQRLLDLEERSTPTFLTQEPIKPWQNEDQWRPLMLRNKYAAIAAQALFGKSFAVTTGTENNGEDAQLVNRAKEESNRFTFGLFAADHSFETATAMGLAFEDKTIRQNETYLYRVYPVEHPKTPLDTLRSDGQNIPIDLHTVIDTGFIATGLADRFALPKIREVEVAFGDKMATVSWNKDVFSMFYVSYQVERSDDGVNWSSLLDLPYVSPEQAGSNSSYMFLIDSLPSNNKPYFYRVLGRTPFDEIGPPSDPVQGMGIDPVPQFFPYIVSMVQTDKGGFDIGWEFRTTDEDKIAGFKILRAPKDQGPFQPVSGAGLLPVGSRNFVDPTPMPTNYYRVVAYDKYNREMSSFSTLAQINDQTPPAAPQNVRGTILKNGTMILTWDPNSEADLLGYRVYISNNPKHEFSQITSRPAPKNHFIDTVSLNTLSKEIYVQVNAVDFRENRSPFSKIAVILRPDTIAPAAPSFTDLTASNTGIELKWANSSSKDVVRHDLQRKAKNQENWETIAQLPFVQGEASGEYIDSSAIVGRDYVYQLVAIDNSDLSTLSPSVEARRIDNFVRPSIASVNISIDRRNKHIELTWDYPDLDKVHLFQIYRGVENDTPRRYKGLEPREILASETQNNKQQKKNGFSFAFRDTALRMNTSYTFRIRALYKDGGVSPLSEPITVDY